jgi:hypothetical protein
MPRASYHRRCQRSIAFLEFDAGTLARTAHHANQDAPRSTAPPLRGVQLAQHPLVRVQFAVIGLDEEAPAAGVANPPRRDRQASLVNEGPDVDRYALMVAMFHVTVSALKHLSCNDRDRVNRTP